jgi:hypothetical protein
MSYITLVCHCEDCPDNENKQCEHMGELEIKKITDPVTREIRAECSVYREHQGRYAKPSSSVI